MTQLYPVDVFQFRNFVKTKTGSKVSRNISTRAMKRRTTRTRTRKIRLPRTRKRSARPPRRKNKCPALLKLHLQIFHNFRLINQTLPASNSARPHASIISKLLLCYQFARCAVLHFYFRQQYFIRTNNNFLFRKT